MKVKEAMRILDAIENGLGELAINDMTTALNVVEIQSKLTKLRDKNSEALKKVVKLTDDETRISAILIKNPQAKFNEPDSSHLKSLKDKDKMFVEKMNELNEMDYKPDLPKIDKNKLPEGIKFKYFSALTLLFKDKKGE